VDGEPRRIGDPLAAHRLGLVAIYQGPTVFPDLTVAESVFGGRPPRGRVGSVDWSQMRSNVQIILDELGVDFGPDTPVRGLGVADRQWFEITKDPSPGAGRWISKEPT